MSDWNAINSQIPYQLCGGGGGGGNTPVDLLTLTNVYVSQANGDNNNSGTSSAEPVQTIEGFFSQFDVPPDTGFIIHLDSGTHPAYALPGYGKYAPIIVIGDGAGQPGDDGFTVEASGTIEAGSAGYTIMSTGAYPTSLIGAFIRFTSGAAVGYCRQIFHIEGAAPTTIETTRSAPWAIGDTFEIVRPAAQIDLTTLTLNQPMFQNIGSTETNVFVVSPPTGIPFLWLYDIATVGNGSHTFVEDCMVFANGLWHTGSDPVFTGCYMLLANAFASQDVPAIYAPQIGTPGVPITATDIKNQLGSCGFTVTPGGGVFIPTFGNCKVLGGGFVLDNDSKILSVGENTLSFWAGRFGAEVNGGQAALQVAAVYSTPRHVGTTSRPTLSATFGGQIACVGVDAFNTSSGNVVLSDNFSSVVLVGGTYAQQGTGIGVRAKSGGRLKVGFAGGSPTTVTAAGNFGASAAHTGLISVSQAATSIQGSVPGVNDLTVDGVIGNAYAAIAANGAFLANGASVIQRDN